MVTDFPLLASKITVDGECKHEIRRQKSCDKPRQCVIKQKQHFTNKSPCSQGNGLSSSHLDVKAGQ